MEKIGNKAEDSSSKIRQNQLNSDIRAREQRNDTTGDRSYNSHFCRYFITRAKLTVKANEGNLVVLGTVSDQKEFNTIVPLAQEILGVDKVNVEGVKIVATKS